MAEFKCDKCGATKETRCQPKNCAACGAKDCMVKMEATPASGGCGCGCGKKAKK